MIPTVLSISITNFGHGKAQILLKHSNELLPRAFTVDNVEELTVKELIEMSLEPWQTTREDHDK